MARSLVAVDQATLERLVRQADATFAVAQAALLEVMTPERCAEVRALRIGSDSLVRSSWRDVAAECHRLWGASWEPASSQLWGMALCHLAALAHGENYRQRPWN